MRETPFLDTFLDAVLGTILTSEWIVIAWTGSVPMKKKAPKAREGGAALAAHGFYAYYSPGPYKRESLAFMRQSLGDEVFNLIRRHEKFSRFPYVPAKLFLSREDWNRYVWIEHYGSLDGFVDR